MTAMLIAGATLLAVLLVMAGEAALSAHNERVLRAKGARFVDEIVTYQDVTDDEGPRFVECFEC